MNSEVLLLGVIVGGVNYLFRYLPLRLRAGHARPARRGPVSVLLDTIGIASICALSPACRRSSPMPIAWRRR